MLTSGRHAGKGAVIRRRRVRPGRRVTPSARGHRASLAHVQPAQPAQPGGAGPPRRTRAGRPASPGARRGAGPPPAAPRPDRRAAVAAPLRRAAGGRRRRGRPRSAAACARSRRGLCPGRRRGGDERPLRPEPRPAGPADLRVGCGHGKRSGAHPAPLHRRRYLDREPDPRAAGLVRGADRRGGRAVARPARPAATADRRPAGEHAWRPGTMAGPAAGRPAGPRRGRLPAGQPGNPAAGPAAGTGGHPAPQPGSRHDHVPGGPGPAAPADAHEPAQRGPAVAGQRAAVRFAPGHDARRRLDRSAAPAESPCDRRDAGLLRLHAAVRRQGRPAQRVRRAGRGGAGPDRAGQPPRGRRSGRPRECSAGARRGPVARRPARHDRA